jgi:hypothetical protein
VPGVALGDAYLAAGTAMLDARLRRVFWRIADGLDYRLTLAWLRILDALAGPGEAG